MSIAETKKNDPDDAFWKALRKHELNAAMLARYLDAGLDPNWTEEDGSPLLSSVLGRYSVDLELSLADLLLERGADPNAGDPPPLFNMGCDQATSWLLQAGADPIRTWGPKGKRPRKMDAWLEFEKKREGVVRSEAYDHKIATIQFWRAKLAPKKNPMATKAFAMFMAGRAVKANCSLESFGLEPLGDHDNAFSHRQAKPASVAAWVDKKFGIVDWVSEGEKTPYDDRWLWAIAAQRNERGWFEKPVHILLYLAEDPSTTEAAFTAEQERSELGKSVKRPVATSGRRPGRGIL